MSTASTERSFASGWLAAAILAEVIATLSLKIALDHTWVYAIVVGGYIIAFTCLDQVLRRGTPIGVAYGRWGAIGVAATAVLSAWLFDEPLNAQMLLGIGVIIAGVLCIELGGKRRR